MPKKKPKPTGGQPGRPRFPEGMVRTDRIWVRTYPDVADKVRRNGTVWLERLIRRAKERDESDE